jgi:Helicase associated domain
MSPDRRRRLEALPGWSWNARSDLWDEGFAHLKEFSEHEGHCRVPYGYKSEDDYRLGIWVLTQRKKKDLMNPDRRQRLEAMPGWSWDPHSDRWEEGFAHLREFSQREGHCRASQGYKTDHGYRPANGLAYSEQPKTQWSLIVGND